MLTFDRDEVARHLPYEALIATLRTGLPAAIATPPRVHHVVGKSSDLLLMMPSWRNGDRVGVKLTTVFPGNAEHGLSMIHAVYTLIDGRTGVPLAVMNGTELTLRRTAALAALATDLLASSKNSGRLLVMGTGALAGAMVRSHLALRRFCAGSPSGADRPRRQKAVVASLGEADGIEGERRGRRPRWPVRKSRRCHLLRHGQPGTDSCSGSMGLGPMRMSISSGPICPPCARADSDLIAGARHFMSIITRQRCTKRATCSSRSVRGCIARTPYPSAEMRGNACRSAVRPQRRAHRLQIGRLRRARPHSGGDCSRRQRGPFA